MAENSPEWRREYLRTPHWQVELGHQVLGQTPTFRQACAVVTAGLAIANMPTTVPDITLAGHNLRIVSLNSPATPICGPELALIASELGVLPPANETKTWEIVIGNAVGQRSSFKTACRLMIEQINTMVKGGSIAAQVLDTATWIELHNSLTPPIFFYEAKDITAEEGWQVKGVWQV
ncbi:MAG: hypothetical protein BWY68_00258 [bacterium ADurb.Bin400]|nr:MAG: hypothetical protein BWY68_00258 [bacterium ADurb.Bin400]